MIISKALPNPIPWEYGYTERETGELLYNRTRTFEDAGDGTVSELNGLRAPRGIFTRLLNGLKPRRQFFGLGDGEAAPATVEDVVGVMNAHNDRVFALTIVSTTAVAVSAFLTVFRTLKLIRDDKRGS